MLRVSRFLPALALLAAWPAAHACDATGQSVAAVMGDKVATYDEQGEYLNDVPKAVIRVGAALVACRESPALIKIALSDGREVWVDRLDVKVSGGKAAPARDCKNKGVSRESDTKAPAVSGIDPCR
jgi:hypothetical protein